MLSNQNDLLLIKENRFINNTSSEKSSSIFIKSQNDVRFGIYSNYFENNYGKDGGCILVEQSTNTGIQIFTNIFVNSTAKSEKNHFFLIFSKWWNCVFEAS